MEAETNTRPPSDRRHLRFHARHVHLAPVFGTDAFGVKAEAFARFFGTPTFLLDQTMAVAVWIAVNAAGLTQFDVYPFILLNLAFSLQAAYAAPLILLAQTRQADRDKAHAEADACIARSSPRRAASARSSPPNSPHGCWSCWSRTRSSPGSRRS
jgi:uncharacterized membrane protein